VKKRFVCDLQPNEVVTDFFAVQSKEVRFKRSGEAYLSLILADRTGRLDAKMWDGISEVAETFERDDVVKVRGIVQLYNQRPQMTVQKLRPGVPGEFELADYIPHTEKDIEAMFAELREAVSGFENKDLRRLVESFLDDPEIAARFKTAPAAKSLHHAFIGGLLEHVVSLARMARLTASHYEILDLDLLLTGVVLHDLGKIYEFEYDRTFRYSNEGQLLGHMAIVLRMIERKCAALPDFRPKLRLLVEHMILSHHGRYEFGSPKLPMFPEALALHYLDDLDSKLESMRASAAADARPNELWTSFNPSLERSLLKKEKFLSEDEEKPAQTGAPAEQTAPAQERDSSSVVTRTPEKGARTLFGERLQSALQGGSSGKS